MARNAAAIPASAVITADERRSGTPRVARRIVRITSWTLLAIVALAVLFCFVSAHAVPGNSDGSTVILEGQSMSTGHLMLQGWALSSDSFWTIDAVVYMFAVLVAGVHAIFLHLVPALIASAVVVTGVHIVRADWRGAAGFAGAAAVLALLALPSHALAFFFLQGPLHVGTALLCLLAFVGLGKGRFGWGWIVAVVLLAAGTIGDLQTIALGVVPALLAGAVGSMRCRNWRTGLPTSAAAVASIALAVVVREVARAIGTFTLVSAAPPQSISQAILNFATLGNYLPKLLGVGTAAGFGSGGAPHFAEYAHGIGLLAVAGGVLVAVVGLLLGVMDGDKTAVERSTSWRLDDLLVFAFFGDLVVFLALADNADPPSARYLTAGVIFGSILAGRLIARLTVRLLRSGPKLRRWGPKLGCVLATAVVGVLATGVAFNLAHPSPNHPYERVGAFLEQHGLHEGIGDYWSSSIVTVETDGSVEVRPVTRNPHGQLVRYARESSSDWYTGQQFTFLVYNPAYPFGNVDTATAVATFGQPRSRYHVAGIEVLVWRHPFTLSSHGIS
jgi:hypothetical protein